MTVLYDAPGPRMIRRSRLISWVTALIVTGLVVYAAVVLGQQGLWNWDRWDIFNDPLVWLSLINALWVNIQAAATATVLALVIGVILSLLRLSDHRFVRIPVSIVLEFFRGMPVLLMMLFILLAFRGVGAYWAVVWALAVYNGAVIGEALRAGFVALPYGQREAGLAIGLGSVRTRLLIEFPQAFRNMLPIILAQVVVLLKDTALGYIVGMLALPRAGELLAEFFGRSQYYFSVFLVMTGMFLVLNLAISVIARRLARSRPIKDEAVMLRDDE